jgi:Luciferase-like monooxygenase
MGAAMDDSGFHKVGKATDLKIRAQRLDEGLAIIDGLWKGEPFTFAAEHLHVDNMTMLPRPFQTPRIPISVVGVWDKPKSMQRALSWDGIIPQRYREWQPFSADEMRTIHDYIFEQRIDDRPFAPKPAV